MRLAYDATAMPANRAGAGVYTYQLGQTLGAALDAHDELLLLDRWRAFCPSPVRTRVEQVPLRGRGHRIFWEQTALPLRLADARVDLFHSPHHSMPLATPCRSVVTVHDVTFRLLPWRYTRARRWYMHLATLMAARRADAIIVPSHSVARDFLRLYGGDRRRVHVVPEAAAPAMQHVIDAERLRAVRERYQLPERFLLSVGTLEPGKNRRALLDALRQLHRRGVPAHLVITGQLGWGVSAIELGGARGTGDYVHLTGYVADADLPALYSLADVFVFPSWREGFGLPPLEAMACGTPVVASDQPAMPEVLGDAALYAPPDRPDILADAIERVLSDGSLRGRLISAGAARSARYSWQRAARETVAVYRSVLRM